MLQMLGPYRLSIAISLLFHGLLLVLVVWGWQSAPSARQVVQPPRYVEAKLVKIRAQSKKVAPPKRQPVKKQESRDEQKKRDAQKKQQQEAKRQAEKKAAEQKRREQAEKERLQKQRDAERRQEQQRLALSEALAEEEALLSEEEDEQLAASFVELIASRIESVWSRPPSARKGMQAELLIQLVPTGKVVSVTVVKSSGNAAFDRSAEQAVRKVDGFPELKDVPPAVFESYFRQLRLVFNPKDLRL